MPFVRVSSHLQCPAASLPGDLDNVHRGRERPDHWRGQKLSHSLMTLSLAEVIIATALRMTLYHLGLCMDPNIHIFDMTIPHIAVTHCRTHPHVQVHRRWSMLQRNYDLYLEKKQFAAITGNFLAWEFELKDGNGGTLGLIDRNFQVWSFV